jgi:hypothetical protein
MYATSGEVRWDYAQGQSLVIKAPGGRRLSPEPLGDIAAAEMPKWFTLDNNEKSVVPILDAGIMMDRPVSLSLKELAEHRRVEVRTLAVRASGYVGQFDPFVAALNDAGQWNDWNKDIEALRAAMARSPETAAHVREVFEKHRGAEAAELYRMLWGYSASDLKDGVAVKLVEYLNHDSLDYRVLSFWNLQTITGKGLYYRPDYPAARRRPLYLKWKERLKEGKLLPTATG